MIAYFSDALARRALPLTLVASLGALGCRTMTEHRMTTPHAEYDGQAHVEARVEKRSGKRKATWKPYVTALTLAVLTGAAGMMVYGFYHSDQRPVAVTGIVISAVLPVAIAIPFLLTPQTPFVRTEWSKWEPAPGLTARVDLMGRETKPLHSDTAKTDDAGHLRVDLAPRVCSIKTWSELGLIDLTITVPDGEGRTLALPVERLRSGVQCGNAVAGVTDAPAQGEI